MSSYIYLSLTFTSCILFSDVAYYSFLFLAQNHGGSVTDVNSTIDLPAAQINSEKDNCNIKPESNIKTENDISDYDSFLLEEEQNYFSDADLDLDEFEIKTESEDSTNEEFEGFEQGVKLEMNSLENGESEAHHVHFKEEEDFESDQPVTYFRAVIDNSDSTEEEIEKIQKLFNKYVSRYI